MQQDIHDIEDYRESNRLETKTAENGLPRSLWETYSSFANTDGGLIVLGIKERRDHSLSIVGVPNADKQIHDFWNLVNDPMKVSANLLTERMVSKEIVDGKELIVINVPRAERAVRPVYINNNPLSGSFRRNGEGDYHCTKEQVSAMLRDASAVTADMKILKGITANVFCPDTVKDYRDRFRAFHPNHIWVKQDDELFLRNIGAMAFSTEDQKYHPTGAGLLMFGYEYEITREFPQFFLDYREEFDSTTRWTHRLVSSSGDWSGNIYDFFFKVYPRLAQHIPTPFLVTDGLNRIDESRSRLAIRELLLNSLAHADYYGRQGIVVLNSMNHITIANPGDMRIALNIAINGGISDPRNSIIMKMFSLVDIGERAGQGIPDAIGALKEELNGKVTFTVRETKDRISVEVCWSEPTDDKPTINKQTDDKTDDKPTINEQTDDKMTVIVNYLVVKGEARTEEIANELGLKPSQTKQYLYRLMEKGLIVANGANRNRTYSIAKRN